MTATATRQTWRERLQSAMAAHPDDRRREFRTAIGAGLSFRQVADATGLAVSTVHTIVGKGHAKRPSLDEEAVDA